MKCHLTRSSYKIIVKNAVEPGVDTKHCNITTDQSIQRTLHSAQGTYVNMLEGLTIGSSLGGTQRHEIQPHKILLQKPTCKCCRTGSRDKKQLELDGSRHSAEKTWPIASPCGYFRWLDHWKLSKNLKREKQYHHLQHAMMSDFAKSPDAFCRIKLDLINKRMP